MKWDRSEGALVGDRYRVDFDRPLPVFDSLGARAYVAAERQERGRALYALVGRDRLPRREAILSRLTDKPLPGFVRPLADAVVTPPSKQPAWATVLERPEGGSLLAHAKVAPFTEDQLRRVVLPQVIQALEGLHGIGLTHRSLRPDRLFWRDAQQTAILVGECFSEPPAYGQPAIYEPAERAAALPAGRGEGVPGCDVYALAVTAAALCLGQDTPCPRPPDDLLETRLVRGSAAVVLAETRLSAEFRALLTALLDDDSQRRWSLTDLRLWLKGANPGGAGGMRTAPNRPVSFSGTTFWNRPLLARALSRASAGAEDFVRSPAFVNWVQNGLNDADASRRIRAALVDGAASAHPDLDVVTAIQRILDPTAPLQFGRFAITLDGIGPALAEAWRKGEHDVLTAIARAFHSGLALEAASMLDGLVGDAAALGRQIAYLQASAGRTAIGWGLERSLYELNPGLSCHSGLIGDGYAPTVGDVLLALDQRAEDNVESLVDRHIAAFVAVREPALARFVAALDGASGELSRLNAELALLAAMQWACGAPKVKGLTRWFAKRFQRHAEHFRGAESRDAARRAIERNSGSGDLGKLAEEVQIADWAQKDHKGFEAARETHRRNAAAINALLAPVTAADPEAVRRGQTGAVAAAYGILAAVTLGLLAAG